MVVDQAACAFGEYSGLAGTGRGQNTGRSASVGYGRPLVGGEVDVAGLAGGPVRVLVCAGRLAAD